MRIRLLCLAVIGAGLVASGRAQLPVCQLHTVFPSGGQQGSTFDVSVAGQELDDLVEMHFSHVGIKAKSKGPGQPFEVTIEPSVPPGIYEARVMGRFGLSNSRAFEVGYLEEVMEGGANRDWEKAQELSLGTIVNGRADSQAVDHFKFEAAKGQRVLVRVQAGLIDSRMDPVVGLFNEAGQELARSRQGQLLDHHMTEDGVYYLRLHDLLYRGGGDYYYRLKVHAGPHIDFLFPPAGLPGETRTFRVYGRNLPQHSPAKESELNLNRGDELEMMEVSITLPEEDGFQRLPGMVSSVTPGGLAFRFFPWHGATNQGPAEPLHIGLATAPVVEETEPNNGSAQAQAVTLPCELAGQFYPARDRDYVTFEAEKGQVIWVEVVSERLGLPTDPFVLLQRVIPQEKGEPKFADVKELYDADTNLGGRSFDTRTRDPLWRFEIKDSGRYQLMVRDLFEYAQSSPAHVYRLSLRRDTPDFQLVAMARHPQPIKKDSRVVQPWPLFLRKGETWPIEVLAFRRDQFDEPIQLSVEGLPEGVHCESGFLEKGKNSALLWVTVDESTGPWAGSLQVTGKAMRGDHEIVRHASSGTVVWRVGDYNNETVRSRESALLTASISAHEPAALIIKPREEKMWKAVAGTKLEIPLQVERHWEFKEKFNIKAVGMSGLEKLKEMEVAGNVTNFTFVIDLKEHKLTPGKHQMALRGLAKGKYRNQPEAVQVAKDSVTKSDKEVVDATAAVKQAKDALAKVEEKAKGEAQKKVAESEAMLKQAQDKQKQNTEAVKRAEEKAKPRDVTITVYSEPIHFEVMPEENKPAEEPKKS